MILVTGGTGLVGAHLLYKLVTQHSNVRAIYRSEKKLEIARKIFGYYTEDSPALFEKIEWVKADLLDIPSLEIAFQNVHHVYHCAAFVSYEPNKYQLLRKTNIEGTANMVNLSLDFNVEKFAYVSSISAVGHAIPGEAITEETPWNSEADNSVYAITKYGAEMEVWRAAQEGLDVVIVNPGVIIGSGIWRHGSGSFFNLVYKGLPYYTKGTIGIIAVQDVVDILFALMQSAIKNERFILIAETWSYKTFLQSIASQLSVRAPKKQANTWHLQLAWRLDWLKSKITGKRRGLTRHLAAILESSSKYNSDKITRYLNPKFTPVEESISAVAKQFLKEL
jgi:nucleoside-diphosphate-sugar epimerase